MWGSLFQCTHDMSPVWKHVCTCVKCTCRCIQRGVHLYICVHSASESCCRTPTLRESERALNAFKANISIIGNVYEHNKPFERIHRTWALVPFVGPKEVHKSVFDISRTDRDIDEKSFECGLVVLGWKEWYTKIQTWTLVPSRRVTVTVTIY